MPQVTLDQALSEAGRLEQAGQFDQAEGIYRVIVQQLPGFEPALAKLALLTYRTGRLEQAIEFLRRASAANPTDINHLGNLGVALAGVGQFEEAAEAFDKALRLQPHNAELHANLGNIFSEQKFFERAVASYQAALTLNPNLPDTWYNLGNTLWELGRYHEAVDAQRQAVTFKPDNANAWYNLGTALCNTGAMDDAKAAFRRALELRPDLGEAYTGLASVYHATGLLRESIDCYRRAVQLIGRANVSGNLLVALHLDPASTPQSLHLEHAEWNQRFARPLAAEIQPHPNPPDANRRIRVGFVSAYLHSRPVGRFLTPLFENHDGDAFDIVCYSDLRHGDATTATLRARCELWRDTETLDDAQLAGQVREDGIDILIDLGMHTRGNRLLTFARKPAPVQVTYLAYCSTTGLETIDYRISDPYLDPTDANQPYYSEKTVRIPSYWCYPPPEHAPDVNDLPAARNAFITFGCLNDFGKVSDLSLKLWARILSQSPNSRLVLHCFEGAHRSRIFNILQQSGVDPSRIDFLGMQSPPQYFATYHRIDIALDPTPWCGGTTTCDSLYMGVPVVTLAGPTAISRGGASILGQISHQEWVTHDHAQYVRTALNLAGDLARLAHLRQSLRGEMQSSRLMDGKAFTREFEGALRTMWKTWCGSQGRGHL
jgi:protein O-GlcNAc transferase